jgi:hypothetical protein
MVENHTAWGLADGTRLKGIDDVLFDRTFTEGFLMIRHRTPWAISSQSASWQPRCT